VYIVYAFVFLPSPASNADKAQEFMLAALCKVYEALRISKSKYIFIILIEGGTFY
jgi:hypothetical protein